MGRGIVHRKNDDSVEFPLDGLDMSKYVAKEEARREAAARTALYHLEQRSQQSNTVSSSLPTLESMQARVTVPAYQRSHTLYDLFAVITHTGTMDNGHYIAYVRAPMFVFGFPTLWADCAPLVSCVCVCACVCACGSEDKDKANGKRSKKLNMR